MLFTVKDVSLKVSWDLAFVYWRSHLASKRQHFVKQVAEGILAGSLPVVNRRTTQATKTWDKQKGCFGNMWVQISVLAITLVQRWVAQFLPNAEQTGENYLWQKGVRGMNFWTEKIVKEKKSGWSCWTLRKGSKRRKLVSHRQNKPQHLYQQGLGEMPCTVNGTSQVSVLQFMTRTSCTVNFAARDVHSGLTRHPVFAVTASPSR